MKFKLTRFSIQIPMKASLFILLILIFTVSCTKDDLPVVDSNNNQFADQHTSILFLIKAGNHYSDQNLPQVMNRNSMSAKVTFDSSAIYTSLDPNNQMDVNKLMGFSDCGNDHQQNSARLGWSWTNKKLELYAYSYVNKIRIIKSMGNFNLNQPLSCSIKAQKEYYYFKVDNVTDSIPRFCADYNSSRYKLFPYFGGDEVAPHDVSILIVED